MEHGVAIGIEEENEGGDGHGQVRMIPLIRLSSGNSGDSRFVEWMYCCGGEVAILVIVDCVCCGDEVVEDVELTEELPFQA